METYENMVTRSRALEGCRTVRCTGRLVLLFVARAVATGTIALAVAVLGSGASAAAAEGPPPDEVSPSETRPKVDLGRLLKLPDSYSQPIESRRGRGQAEWRARFETVRFDLLAAQTALEKAKTELAAAATDSSQWAVAAPGTAPNPENTPLSYKLRQEIRGQREAVEAAERKLRALEIEADLAEVPREWRANDEGRGEQEPPVSVEASAIEATSAEAP